MSLTTYCNGCVKCNSCGDWLSRLVVASVLNKLLFKHSGDVGLTIVSLSYCMN